MAKKRLNTVLVQKSAPREKSRYLEEKLSEEVLDIIKKEIKRGAVLIVLGSEESYTQRFYKGLMQLMYAPTTNGACVYDTHYVFDKAFHRPYVTIAINDPGNMEVVHEIREITRYRSRALYRADYSVD